MDQTGLPHKMFIVRVELLRIVDRGSNAVLHLSRCSFRKGDDQQAVYIERPHRIRDQRHDPCDKDGSLPAACGCAHQNILRARRDDFLLIVCPLHAHRFSSSFPVSSRIFPIASSLFIEVISRNP